MYTYLDFFWKGDINLSCSMKYFFWNIYMYTNCIKCITKIMNHILYDTSICLSNLPDSAGLVFIWRREIRYLTSLFTKWFNALILHRHINCNSSNRSHFNYIPTNMSRSTHCINESMLNKAFGTVGYPVQKENDLKQIRN